MALQLIQQPTDNNAAYTRLLYTVSGSVYTAEPQFQYVCDIYSGSDLIKRLTQGINPAGTATFDVARIIQGELNIDYNWKINTPTAFNSSSKTFNIKMGEQYGTSISSSVTVTPDQTNDSLTTFLAIVEPNNGIGYNWQSSSYAALTNQPTTASMQYDDSGTISVYNEDTVYVSQSFYSASSTTAQYDLVEQKNYTITDTFSSFPISSSVPYWNYVDVSISSSLGTQEYRYEVSDETHREKTRFAFINKLGAWDYYNNYNPVKQAINVSREQYTAPRVDYSSTTSTYDIERRGLSDYHNSTDDVFTVITDLLDQTSANWLEELIESPEVYIQRNGEFIPIIITDSDYVANTNQARQKQFQYSINFKPSNQPYGKWIPEYVECPKQLIQIPQVITDNATNITTGSIGFNGNITTQGTYDIDIRGFAYSTSSTNPTIADDVVSSTGGPFGEGAYSIDSGQIFQTSSLVYYKAFVSTSLDIYYASNVVSASTLDFIPIQAVTNTPTAITDFTFTMNGEIPTGSTDSIIERGFVLSKTDATPEIGETDVLKFIKGSGTGTYDYYLSGSNYLSASQNYYYRAYASSSGNAKAYGVTEQFDTLDDFCIYTLNTLEIPFSDKETFALTMSADLTASANNSINEVGFYYSSQSTNPGPSDSVVTKSGVVAPFTDTSYTLPVSGLDSFTTYYFRAYGKNTIARCDDTLGNIQSSSTLAIPFDPTLDGEITPYYWYDFSDTGSMQQSGSGTPFYFDEVTSKGSNTGTIAKGPDTWSGFYQGGSTTGDTKYSGSYWTAPIQSGSYAVFNPEAVESGSNSTLARKWGTGNFNSEEIFATSSAYTAISFTRPHYLIPSGGFIDTGSLISVKMSGSSAPLPSERKAEEITFLGVALTGSIDLDPAAENALEFVSTDTTNFVSMSFYEYESPQSDIARDYIGYSYSGSVGGWQSSYTVYLSGSNQVLEVGREPISSSQVYTTSSVVNAKFQTTPNVAEGLAFGTRAFIWSSLTSAGPTQVGQWDITPYKFDIAQFVLYSGSLTSDQIQRVIDNFSASDYSVPFNTFEN